MTEDQLYALLDSYEQRVSNREDRELFVEAVRAAKASAPRAAYFTLWICCVESLKRRFEDVLKQDYNLDGLLTEISAMELTYEPTVLIEAARQHNLISEAGVAKLQRIHTIQQMCRCGSEESPQLKDFVADSFAVVDSVLCRSGLLECRSASEQVLILSRDLSFLVDNVRQQLLASAPAQIN